MPYSSILNTCVTAMRTESSWYLKSPIKTMISIFFFQIIQTYLQVLNAQYLSIATRYLVIQ